MRIEISARETGPLQAGLSDLHTTICSTIASLQRTRSQFYNMSGGVSNLSDAVDSLDQRIRYEERKLDAVKTLNRKTTAFLSNTVSTDAQVARMIVTHQEQFFRQYEWLRPAVPEEKSWWEQKLDHWNQFWQGAGEAFRNLTDKVGDFLSGAVDLVKETVQKAFQTVVTFVKEHWVELVVGAAAIVLGAAVFAITGGTAAAFGMALLSGLKAAAISAAIDGAVSTVIAWVTGGDAGKAFGDGLASGFMFGGITFAAGSLQVLRTSLKTKKMIASGEMEYINLNKVQGKKYEIAKGKEFKAKYPQSAKQITIETKIDGKTVKFRIDQMGYDKHGNLVLQELKSSPTAKLTKNQKLAWGKNVTNKSSYGVLEHGGVVKGRPKATLFKGGFEIPPGTKIQIVRPPMPFRDVEMLHKLSKFSIYSGGTSEMILHNTQDLFNRDTARRERAYVY